MADNDSFEKLPPFSITDTNEAFGNTQLLETLLSPETATASPADVTVVTEDEKKSEEKKSEDKKKEAKKPDTTKEDQKVETEKQLSSLLEDDKTDPALEPGKEGSTKDPDPELNQFESLSKDLFELNVFTKDDEEEEVKIDTPEAFLNRFNYEKRKQASEELEKFLSQFGEDYKHAFQAIFVNGVDPREYYSTYNNIEDIANLDLTKEPNQEAIIRKSLSEQSWEAAEINEEVERIKQSGDLENVAKRHQKALSKIEASKLQRMEQEKAEQLKYQQSVKQQYIQNVNNILAEKVKTKDFDGIPINSKFAQEVQDYLVTDKWNLPSGELLTDFDKAILDLKRPENHNLKVKVGIILKMLEKDPTLSTIQKTAQTKKADTLFANTVKKDGSKKEQTKEEKPLSWFVNTNN